jgi:hypothetical protein
MQNTTPEADRAPCRSELARDDLKSAALNQSARIIVNDHRRNAARSKRAPTEKHSPMPCITGIRPHEPYVIGLTGLHDGRL